MAMMTYTVILTVVNFLLIGALLTVYLRNYRQLKAPFSLGLLIFSIIFLIQKIVSIYVFIVEMHQYEHIIGNYLFILEILQTIAFSVLAWITLK